jgi:hypothetical protein
LKSKSSSTNRKRHEGILLTVPYGWRLRWERFLLNLSEGWLRLPPHGYTIEFQEAEIARLERCADLLAEALMKHDQWCGHRRRTPDQLTSNEALVDIYYEAMDEYQKALVRRRPHRGRLVVDAHG